MYNDILVLIGFTSGLIGDEVDAGRIVEFVMIGDTVVVDSVVTGRVVTFRLLFASVTLAVSDITFGRGVVSLTLFGATIKIAG